VSSDAVFPLPTVPIRGAAFPSPPAPRITHWWNVRVANGESCWCLERPEASASPRAIGELSGHGRGVGSDDANRRVTAARRTS